MAKNLRADYDSPWKDALESFLRPFLALCFPKIEADVDWSRPIEFLDKELQKLVRDAKDGRRHVDKLVKIWRRSGIPAWVHLHVEVQQEPEDDFGERMFLYRVRLRLGYGKLVVCLAVLTDDREDWRPNHYEEELWDCSDRMELPVAKLLDFAHRRSELESSDNPFAVVILAHLDAMATDRNPDERARRKVRSLKALYHRGLERKDALELLRLVDWLMVLPRELETEVQVELDEFEEKTKMPYITSWERAGIRKGIELGEDRGRAAQAQAMVLQVLTRRFGEVPDSLRERVAGAEPGWCQELLDRALDAESIAEITD